MRIAHQGQWLKAQIALAGLSKVDYAKRVGVSRDTLMRWLREEELSARPDLLVSAIKALGWDVEAMMADTAKGRVTIPAQSATSNELVSIAFRREIWSRLGSPLFSHYHKAKSSTGDGDALQNVEPYSMMKLVAAVPTFDLAVAAGGWSDVSGQIEIYDKAQIEQGLFRVQIRGDSMQPLFPDGSLVEFRIVRRGRDGWPVGQNCYVQLASGDATFKRLDGVDEDTIRLSAINKQKYRKPLTAATSDVVSLAVAVGIFTPVGV